MGYTHYFKHPKPFTTEQWVKIAAATSIIMARTNILFGWDGTGNPEITDSLISFNGDSINCEENETFELTKTAKSFAFCKTASKAYDCYVVAVLCIANHYAPNIIELTSDGDAADWEAGLAIAQSVVPECTNPLALDESIT